jgi:hypothetical protein
MERTMQSNQQQPQQHPTPGLERLQRLGLRLAPASIPAVPWNRWQVVARPNGCFHVSRESASGAKTEAITNAVGRTTVFRSRAQAEKACAKANFTGECERLKAEPLLAGGGAA